MGLGFRGVGVSGLAGFWGVEKDSIAVYSESRGYGYSKITLQG